LIAVEINPRVSRSSALASKATGYPIAKVAAKLAIGYTLDELKNQITQNTSAYFEPALDYVIVKVPRWNFDKFKGGNDTLGLQMKSVGEVMAIGRSFTEALQKACQSLENDAVGLGYYGKSLMKSSELLEYIKVPKWDRIFRIKDALMQGVTVKTIAQATGIDPWFLYQIQKICTIEKEVGKYTIETLPAELLKDAKKNGFGDEQIARILRNCTEHEVYEKRKALGITRVYKMVDTCAAEFEAKTPYFYSSFE
jgi:carbamoyl-phosphate synthase large subunit